MYAKRKLFTRTATMLTTLIVSAVSVGAAPTTAPAAPAALPQSASAAALVGTRFPIKDFSDKNCFTYGNAKASFSTETGQAICKVVFGTGDGIFGGFWFPTKKLTGDDSGCRGLGLIVRGNGDSAGKAYVFLRTANGVSYRSNNINKWFENTEWQEVVLTAGDFMIDPDYAAHNAEAAKTLPKQPDWQSFNRVEFSTVNFGGEPTIELKALYFAFGNVAPAAAPAVKPSHPAAKPVATVVQTIAGPAPLTPLAGRATFPEGTWLHRHEKFVARAKQGGVDLLWLGDSITDRWNQFRGTYSKYFADVKAANFGIDGDKTQNLLWRLENGELDGIKPKVVILLIGTNNVQWDPSTQIAAAVTKIVKTIRVKSPTTKILLMGIFPRGDLPVSSPAQKRIKEVNAVITKLDDGKNVHYLDISSKLTNPEGTIIGDAFMDRVHLSPKGFSIWAKSIRPLLDEMMK